MADEKKSGFASGKPGSARYALTGGGLKDVYGGKWRGPNKRKLSNRAKAYGTYAATTVPAMAVGGAAGAGAGVLVRRALKGRGGPIAPIVGVLGGYESGALTGNMLGSRISHKRGYAKKNFEKDVEKSALVLAAKPVGRFRRLAEGAAIGGAREAGRGWRYVRRNAMPLAIGASVGGGAATAYQQMSDRRKMSKADNEYAYVMARLTKSYVSVSRGASEGLQRLVRRSNALQAMKESADPAVAARGRMLDRRMTAGMKRRAAVQAGQVKPRVKKSLPSHLRRMSRKSPGMYKAPGTTYAGQRVAASQVGRLNPAAGRGLQASVGGELRAKSRVTLAQQGGRKRLRSPRNAAAMGLNSYRNPLRNV